MYAVVLRDSLALLAARWKHVLVVLLACLPVVLLLGAGSSFVVHHAALGAAKAKAKQEAQAQDQVIATQGDPSVSPSTTPTKTVVDKHPPVSHNPSAVLASLGVVPAAMSMVASLLLLASMAFVFGAAVRATRIDEEVKPRLRHTWETMPRMLAQVGPMLAIGLVTLIVAAALGGAMGAPGTLLGFALQLGLLVVLVPAWMLAVADCALYDRDWVPVRTVTGMVRQLPPTLGLSASIVVAMVIGWFIAGSFGLLAPLFVLPLFLFLAPVAAILLEFLVDDHPDLEFAGTGDEPEGEFDAVDGEHVEAEVHELAQPTPAGYDDLHGGAYDPAVQAAVQAQQPQQPQQPQQQHPQQAQQHPYHPQQPVQQQPQQHQQPQQPNLYAVPAGQAPAAQPAQQAPRGHAVLTGATDPAGAPSGGWINVQVGGHVTLCVVPVGLVAVHVADQSGSWQQHVPPLDGAGTTTFPLHPGAYWVNVTTHPGQEVLWRIDAWLPAAEGWQQAA
jgi:hypothetical protein